jgi:hypothetical protein
MHKWKECTQKNVDSDAAPSGFHSGFRILAFDDDDDDDLSWPVFSSTAQDHGCRYNCSQSQCYKVP